MRHKIENITEDRYLYHLPTPELTQTDPRINRISKVNQVAPKYEDSERIYPHRHNDSQYQFNIAEGM